MSSRCAYDGLPERYKNVEMPLPTYDEVVGAAAAAPSVGFKPDVLLASPSTSRQAADRRTDDAETHYVPAPKSSNRTVIILSLIGSIIIPMCAMIIILQVKVCTAPSKDQQSEAFMSKTESDKLLKDYQNLYDEKTSIEYQLENLQMQISRLSSEKKKLEQKLKNSSTASPTSGANNTSTYTSASNSPSESNTSTSEATIRVSPENMMEARLKQLVDVSMKVDKIIHGQSDFKGIQDEIDSIVLETDKSQT